MITKKYIKSEKPERGLGHYLNDEQNKEDKGKWRQAMFFAILYTLRTLRCLMAVSESSNCRRMRVDLLLNTSVLAVLST